MKILRILNLDGGGMKGLFSSYFMQNFCVQAGINGNEIWKHFDFIGGSSIGAIIGAAYATGNSPDTLISFFQNYGSQIFTGILNTTGSGPLSATSKLAAMAAVNIAAGEGSFYGTSSQPYNPLSWYKRDLPNQVLRTQLQNTIGASTLMFQLKTNVLFTGVERVDNSTPDEQLQFNYRPVLFSNMLAPGLEGQNYNVCDVVQASGSAPFYFPPYPIIDSEENQRLYLDGGIGINNPSNFLLAYSGLFDSDYDRIVMLSIGCGLGTVGFYDPTTSLLKDPGALSINANIEYMQQMIGVAGGSAQEAAAQQMQLLSDLNVRINGADFIHYRFNASYPPTIKVNGADVDVDSELDNTSSNFLQLMKDTAAAQILQDQQKIAAFIYNCDF